MPYEELLIALENVIIDKVTTHSASKVKKIDTSGSNGDQHGCRKAPEEGYRIESELAVQAGYKGAGAKGGWNGAKAPVGAYRGTSTEAEVQKGANRAGKGQWSRMGGQKGGTRAREWWQR